MVFDLEKVKSTVKIYADEVRQVFPVEKVFLYGSYARGTATEHSDVDVCFFLTSIDDQDFINIMTELFNISNNYDLDIEPNLYKVSDLYDNHLFVIEVLRTGIEIL
jgi:predicted nucleotidyltransferase